MQYKFTFIFLLVYITGAYSQQSSNPLIDQGSEVLLDRLPENDFYYTHIFQKGQTVYSLARTFKTSVSEIYAMNNLTAKTPIDVGQTVKVPFTLDALYTESSSTLKSSEKYVPVYYLAQAKETLYRIGKTYFGQDVLTFSKRNKIEGTSISIGQKLLIGWLPLDGQGPIVRVNTTIAKSDSPKARDSDNEKIKNETYVSTPTTFDNADSVSPTTTFSESVQSAVEDDMKTVKGTPFKQKQRAKFVTTIITPESVNAVDNALSVPTPDNIKQELATAEDVLPDTLAMNLEENIEVEVPTTRTRRTRGIGIWERESTAGGMAFVLHHTAKKGSTIELYNPQLNLRTRAKVLGRIPMGTYPSDVSVIMSRKVANSLGALDTRFMVELSFIEEIN